MINRITFLDLIDLYISNTEKNTHKAEILFPKKSLYPETKKIKKIKINKLKHKLNNTLCITLNYLILPMTILKSVSTLNITYNDKSL